MSVTADERSDVEYTVRLLCITIFEYSQPSRSKSSRDRGYRTAVQSSTELCGYVRGRRLRKAK